MAFETVTSGFGGASWAEATAANKSTEVKSFIEVSFRFGIWIIIMALFATLQEERRAALPHRLFQLQQQTLAPQPAAIAAQLPVLIDHAMTRNQNRDPIASVGGAHRARRSGTPNRPRQFLVGPRFAVGDPQQARPHLALECRPRIGQRDS